MNTENNIWKIGVASGLVTTAGLIAYFVIMKYLDLLQVLELRAFNFFILLAGILFSYNRYRHLTGKNPESYFEGMAIGILTTGVSALAFSVFVGVYLELTPGFMEYIKAHAMMGQYLTPSAVAIVISIEEVISGLIISFACMQYFRKYEATHAG